MPNWAPVGPPPPKHPLPRANALGCADLQSRRHGLTSKPSMYSDAVPGSLKLGGSGSCFVVLFCSESSGLVQYSALTLQSLTSPTQLFLVSLKD